MGIRDATPSANLQARGEATTSQPMESKQAIREAVWDDLEGAGVARFPFPPHGRIPNFEGATEAADRACTLEWWSGTTVIKSNPDAPQRPLRKRALMSGKTLVMAAPRLRGDRPFLVLDPAEIPDPPKAATIGGATEHGVPHRPEELPTIDGIVVGSVAVDEGGRRIGKGEGYSDLEFGLLLEEDRIDREVPILTTIHERQFWGEPISLDPHDVPVDLVVTPRTARRAIGRPDRPRGIDWEALPSERLDEIPVLRERAPR